MGPKVSQLFLGEVEPVLELVRHKEALVAAQVRLDLEVARGIDLERVRRVRSLALF